MNFPPAAGKGALGSRAGWRAPSPRRWLMAIVSASALSVGPLEGAYAIDFTLPKFEDLRPKWDSVNLGLPSQVVVQVMGSPSGRSEILMMGVPHLALKWKDMKGQCYTAKFLGDRLYAKETTDIC